MLSLWLGMAAGALQVLGYVCYVWGMLRHERDPNPTAWLMWAYGTSLLAVIEWDRGATLVELGLPVICAISSIGVALYCWRKEIMRWPEEFADRAVLVSDVLITIGYVFVWAFFKHGELSEGSRLTAALVFLLLSNATTFTSFVPQLREYAKHPNGQSALPWIVWASAYVTLGCATYLEKGFASELMLYPVSCAIIHAWTAWLVRPARKARFETTF